MRGLLVWSKVMVTVPVMVPSRLVVTVTVGALPPLELVANQPWLPFCKSAAASTGGAAFG